MSKNWQIHLTSEQSQRISSYFLALETQGRTSMYTEFVFGLLSKAFHFVIGSGCVRKNLAKNSRKRLEGKWKADFGYGRQNTVEALVSDHLGNSKKVVVSDRMVKQWRVVAYESFRNSLIIHKEKTKEINVSWESWYRRTAKWMGWIFLYF